MIVAAALVVTALAITFSVASVLQGVATRQAAREYLPPAIEPPPPPTTSPRPGEPGRRLLVLSRHMPGAFE